MNENQIKYYKRKLIKVEYTTKQGYRKAFEKFPYKKDWFKNAFTFKTIFKLKKLKFSNEEIEKFIGIELIRVKLYSIDLERFYFKYYSDYLILKELNFLDKIFISLNYDQNTTRKNAKLKNLEKHILSEKMSDLI